MDFTENDDQAALRALVREFASERSPEETVRRLMTTELGYDVADWRTIAAELGLVGIAVPEEQGGLGLGTVELAIVLEEFGAALACSPFFSTVVLGCTVLVETGGEVADEMLPKLIAGEATATLAVSDDGGRWDADRIATTATGSGAEWTVTGTKQFVVDGASADLLLVAARTPDGLGLFLVDGSAAGVTRTTLETMDQTRRFATIVLDAAPAQLVTAEASGVLARVHDVAMTALAAEQLGGAGKALSLAVEYAKIRFQFGRPIGSFQAIKHRCADLLIEIEAARAAVGAAAWAADHDPAGLPLAAAMAKATASTAFSRTAAETIQIHGGIGFTWEHPAHLYFKRAKSSELWFGGAAVQRERIGRLLQLT